MKLNITFLLTFCSLISLTANAQTPLPYSTGFDNSAEQAGWQAFKTGIDGFGQWGIASFQAASSPNCLEHDYPVGSPGSDSVIDWYVSPLFDFTNGAELQLKINMYSFSGSAWATDECAVYLLQGNANPALAQNIQLLASFTYMATNSTTYKDTAGIIIPATTGNCYIAFKYKTTNNWFTPRIDDILITGNPTSVQSFSKQRIKLKISPNPAKNTLKLQYNNLHIQSLKLTDLSGRVVKIFPAESKSLDVSGVAAGLHFLQVKAKEGEIADKIMIHSR